MRATAWEFCNRAAIFGGIFGVAFALYAADRENAAAALAKWLGASLHSDADRIARLLDGPPDELAIEDPK